jgi:hypothetical protein
MESLHDGDLLKTISIRNKPYTVLDAVNRQLGHYAYHIGQLVYLAKARKGNGWQSLSVPKINHKNTMDRKNK